MPRERKRYSRSFKLDAVRVYENGELTAHQVERDLGITPGLLGKWKTELKQQNQKRGGNLHSGQLIEAEIRIRQLEHENAILKEEKEILRKALDMFSRMADEILVRRDLPERIQWTEAPFARNQVLHG